MLHIPSEESSHTVQLETSIWKCQNISKITILKLQGFQCFSILMESFLSGQQKTAHCLQWSFLVGYLYPSPLEPLKLIPWYTIRWPTDYQLESGHVWLQHLVREGVSLWCSQAKQSCSLSCPGRGKVMFHGSGLKQHILRQLSTAKYYTVLQQSNSEVFPPISLTGKYPNLLASELSKFILVLQNTGLFGF